MSVSMKSSAAAFAALIGVVGLMPSAASAQSYGYNNGYQNQGYSQGYSQPYNQGYSNNGYQSQDRCRTLGQGRTGAGALIGAGVGAVAGSQIAARGNRTEGSIIGGVLGAFVGAQVGRSSNSNCQSNGYASNGYASNGYTSNGYQGSAYAPASNYYNEQGRYDDRSYSSNRRDDRRYDNRSNDRRYDNGYQVSADGYYYFDPRRGWLPR